MFINDSVSVRAARVVYVSCVSWVSRVCRGCLVCSVCVSTAARLLLVRRAPHLVVGSVVSEHLEAQVGTQLSAESGTPDTHCCGKSSESSHARCYVQYIGKRSK